MVFLLTPINKCAVIIFLITTTITTALPLHQSYRISQPWHGSNIAPVFKVINVDVITGSLIQPRTFTVLPAIFKPSSAISTSHPFTRTIDKVPAASVPAPWLDRSGICMPQSTTRILKKTNSLCDPSGLLSTSRETVLNTQLSQIYLGIPPYSLVTCSSASTKTGFRVAMLVIRSMPASPGSVSERTSRYVDTVFRDWKLDGGCQASVLVFVSWEDRQMYIKTGSLAAKYISEKDIDNIFGKMGAYLTTGYIYQALVTASDSIGTLLQKYKSPYHNDPLPVSVPPPPSSTDKGRFGDPLYWKGGPDWWDLGLSLVLVVAALFLVIACCNGVGGPDAARLKKEKKYLLRKLNTVRTEYIRSTLPDYTPSTCSVCQDELQIHTILSTPKAETDPLVPPPEEDEDDISRKLKSYRCGHTMHESCLSSVSGALDNPWKCPVCGDTPGVDEHAKSLSDSRGDDYKFRLQRMKDEYPHLITADVYTTIASISPTHWPDTLDETFLKPAIPSSPTSHGAGGGRSGGGGGGGSNWMGTVGGALAAGGIGAMIGSALSGGGNGRSGRNGRGHGGTFGGGGGHGGTFGGGGGHGGTFGGGGGLGGAFGGGGGHGGAFGGGGGLGGSFGGGGGGGGHGGGF